MNGFRTAAVLAPVLLPVVLFVASIAYPPLGEYLDDHAGTIVVVEMTLMLTVAPLITKRLVTREAPVWVEQHIRPAVRDEIDRFTKPTPPTQEEIQQAQAAFQANIAAGVGSALPAFTKVLDDRLQALEESLMTEEPESPAQTMAHQAVDARQRNKMAREEFWATVQRAGVGAVVAARQFESLDPQSFRGYELKGAAGAMELYNSVKNGGINPGLGGLGQPQQAAPPVVL